MRSGQSCAYHFSEDSRREKDVMLLMHGITACFSSVQSLSNMYVCNSVDVNCMQ